MGLTIRSLKKDFIAPDGARAPVVEVEHLDLRGGEQAALMGSSGSGKTTLLHLIAGILPVDSGHIIHTVRDGETRLEVDITSLGEASRDVFRGRYIGYIFQTHHLLAGFTALENILIGMSFTGRKHDHAWATHLLERVGLADRQHYRPAKLSVGQRQRVAAARALANRPALVLADEPTGALDARNAQQVLDLIRGLCDEVKSTLLLVTHDPQIAGQLQRTLLLSEINTAGASPAFSNPIANA